MSQSCSIRNLSQGRVENQLNDAAKNVAYSSIMTATIAKIHQSKQPVRIHYIQQWAEKRGLRQTDIARGIPVDKGTVSKWFSGSLPAEANLIQLAAYLHCEPNALFRHPDDDWFAHFFADRKAEEIERMRQTLELTFPKKTG